jgi:hypothetical protein
MRHLTVTVAMFGLIALITAAAIAASTSTADFTIAGGEFTVKGTPNVVVLGWRGAQPGATMRVYRDGNVIVSKANPQAQPFNVYLTHQPPGTDNFQVCTGTASTAGFAPAACSQILPLGVH